MIIGIVSCSKKKLPVPAPAFLLYSASPRFAQAYIAAKQECSRVLILSAKYMLVEPHSILKPYELVLSELREEERDEWHNQVLQQLRDTLDSATPIRLYVSEQYSKVFEGRTNVTRPYPSGFFTQATAIGKRGSIKQIDWPMWWLLERIQVEGIAEFEQVKKWCAEKGYMPATQDAQAHRVLNCPLYSRSGKMVKVQYK